MSLVRTVLVFGLLIVANATAPRSAGAQSCGGDGQIPCSTPPACRPGYRLVVALCQSSGFSVEPNTGVVTMPVLQQPDTGPVRGIADLHTHQFSNLGFGGVIFWGAPYDAGGINDALAWCDYTTKFPIVEYNGVPTPFISTVGPEVHGPPSSQPTGNLAGFWLEGGASHAVGGTGAFDGWPTYKTYTHQQMYYKWVERAFLGGVRLMVVHMVSNEALCSATRRRQGWSCNDMEAVERQIDAVKALEQAIDRIDDGQANGTGWYQIAYTPAQARSIIRSGRLAVVMGIEVDSLFDCKPGTPFCTEGYVRTWLQYFRGRGIRHLFPIHQFDNAFGGAAIFRNELNAGNAVVTGRHFEVRNCKAEGYTYNVAGAFVDLVAALLRNLPYPDPNYYNQFEADCNARGLTARGEFLIDEMMNQHYIIDIDHMSKLMMDRVLAMALGTRGTRTRTYPLVSGHSSFQYLQPVVNTNEFSLTNDQLAVMKQIGGMITAINPKGRCQTTADFKIGFDFAVNAVSAGNGDPFAAVGFSSDMNGFAGSTGPRFDPGCAPPATFPRLEYPFVGIMGGTFGRHQTGSRIFNLNDEGVAQYGMFADFFADLKVTGMTDAELEPLLNSAESYIRVWETVEASDPLPTPRVTSQIVGTEGTNGWYTSDVSLSWTLTPSPGVWTLSPSGCAPVTITADTVGTTYACTATNPTGGSISASVVIKRDATPPTFSASRVTPPNAEGWNNTNVRVTFLGDDALSGIAGAGTFDVVVTEEGADQVARHTFFDVAGNSTIASLDRISIDRTPPLAEFRFANLPPTATPGETSAEFGRWHNAPVTLVVEPTDALSGVATTVPAQITLVGEGPALMGSTTVTDRAGNSSGLITSQGVKIDLTPPTIQFVSRAPLANANGWSNSDLTLTWSCADALSGVPATEVVRTLVSEGAGQTLTGECIDRATNGAANAQSGLSLDKTPPTLLPVVIPNPVVLNALATASAGAADALSGVLVQGCTTTDTTSVGAKALTCTATDKAGNVGNAVAGYQVVYPWTGFFQPVDTLPTVNVVNAGQGVPVKFSLGGNQGLNVFAAGFPASAATTCGATAADDVEETVSAGASTLSYDAASDRYTYVWKTDRAWGNTCRTFTVRFMDGSVKQANFQFRK